MDEAPSGRTPADPFAPSADAVLARDSAPGGDYAPLSLPDMFFASVAAVPGATLVDFLGRRFSYARLGDQARAFAAGLQALGIGKGDRVGLFLPNVPLYVPAYYGTLLAGASVANYMPMWDAAQLARALRETSPSLVLTLDTRALYAVLAAARREAPVPTTVVAPLGPMLRSGSGLLYRLGARGARPGRDEAVPLAQFLRSEVPDPVAIDPVHDVAQIQYTSGTTGTPRPVRLSHQNLTANARQLRDVDPWRDQRDVMLGVLPLAGTFASSAILNRTVLDRGSIALLPQFQPRRVLRTIARTRATAMPGVPLMYQALLDDAALGRADLSSLRLCVSGGTTLPALLKERFEAVSGANLIEGYGLAEATAVVSVNPFDQPQHAGTVGRPLPGTRWKLLAPDDRDLLPGEPGELAVSGPQVMLGYWNDPAADAAAFADGWLRTGDYATIDADGFATIVDRADDVMTVAGERIFPSLIEKVLLRHEAVREAVVIAVPDAFRGQSPKAFVTITEETLENGESLRNWLNGRLPAKNRVISVEVRDMLPRIPIGKLDRRTLRAEEAARAARHEAPA